MNSRHGLPDNLQTTQICVAGDAPLAPPHTGHHPACKEHTGEVSKALEANALPYRRHSQAQYTLMAGHFQSSEPGTLRHECTSIDAPKP